MDGSFWYVYMFHSLDHPEHYYLGMMENLRERLKTHNAGKVPHTSKLAPWRIETTIAFRSKDQAVAFESYLKTRSGRAFAIKHF